jgi:DNA-binding HxlR family transcriptional regulator
VGVQANDVKPRFLLESVVRRMARMPKRAKLLDPQCRAFQAALEVLGRPWTGLILGVLLTGPLRFGELGARTRGAGDKVLSARLKDLEARGLVARRVEKGPPVRVLYALTPTGRAFGRVGAAIERWGETIVGADKKAPRPSRRAG